MGLLRKINSVTTLGMVRFRTPDERTARHTRQTRNAVRQGNQYLYGIQQATAQPVADSTVMSMRAWINAPGWVAPCGHPRQQWSVNPSGVASCRVCWMTVCPYCGKAAPPSGQ